MAHYALEGLPNKVLAAEYRMTLPDEKLLAAEIDRTRAALERRQIAAPVRRNHSPRSKSQIHLGGIRRGGRKRGNRP